MKSSCKVLFSFLAFLLLSIEGAFAAAPEITADAAVIYDPAAQVFLYEKDGTAMVVSRGLGGSRKLPLRIGNRPEGC